MNSIGTSISANLGDHLPFWDFDEDFMVYEDGSLGAGFKIAGIDITRESDEFINQFSGLVENFINSLPEGFRLQVFYRLTSTVESSIKSHQDLSEKINDAAYKKILQERLKHLHDLKKNKLLYQPDIFLFLRSPKFQYPTKGFFEKESRFSTMTWDTYSQHKERFSRVIKMTVSFMENCKLRPKELSNEEWIKLLYEYFNYSRSQKIPPPKIQRSQNSEISSTSLVGQFTLSDIQFNRNQLVIDGKDYFKVVSLNKLPDQTYASMIHNFCKLPFNYWISINIEIPDQKKEYDKLQMKRRVAHSFVNGSNNVRDMESESKLGHIEDLLSDLLESSEKIILSDFSVLVWGKDSTETEEKVDEVLKAFKSMNQSEGTVENIAGLDAFFASCPGSCKIFRKRKMKTSNLAHLLPLYSYWEGNSKPVILTANRDQILLSLDLFEQTLPNWNGLVIGGAGSGKSFTLCQLVLMFYGQTPKPKIVWLDNGASSRNIVDILDGQFIDLKLDSNMTLNLFDLAPGEITPSPEKIKLILGVIESITKDENTRGLPKREKALLEECILNVYIEKFQTEGDVIFPTLSDLKEILTNHHDLVMRNLGQILYPWTGNTPFGKLLDGKTNITLNKDLVSIEMKGLDAYPELQNVFLLVLTDFIKREATSNVGQKYLLIIDEAWKLFETDSGAAFTVEAYRTFRKFNSGIWAISQNIHDFRRREDIASAILQNTPSRIILKQRSGDWDQLQKILSLNDIEIEIIKSLKQVKGEYSEFYFIQDDQTAIVKHRPDPLSYWICTTDPLDKIRIEKMSKNHPEMNKLEILNQLAISHT